MVPLSSAGLLGVWERGLKKGAAERALALLAAACPDLSPEALGGLSVGRRDAALLKLRESIFGREMTGNVACARCGQLLELALESSRLQQPSCDATESPEVSSTTHGYKLRMRLLNSNDLLGCAGLHFTEIPKQLFARCLIAAEMEGETVLAEQLPDEVVQAAAEELAKADPQANVELDISCAACGHQWRELFDIVSFFWIEIDAWARRMLRNVHALALAYGWSETEILGLSELRRQCYLEMAGAWATS